MSFVLLLWNSLKIDAFFDNSGELEEVRSLNHNYQSLLNASFSPLTELSIRPEKTQVLRWFMLPWLFIDSDLFSCTDILKSLWCSERFLRWVFLLWSRIEEIGRGKGIGEICFKISFTDSLSAGSLLEKNTYEIDGYWYSLNCACSFISFKVLAL